MPLELINPLTTSNTTTLSVSNNATIGGNLNVNGGFVPSTSYNMRNKIINGNFDFWQRGTSLSSGTGARYLADRWLNNSSGTTYTTSQQPFTLGQTSVPNEPSLFHRTVVSSVAGSSNFCVLAQRIESVRTLAGKTTILSFWAKADATKNISVNLTQVFGGGGSPSSTVVGIGATTCNLTTSWQKFTVTVSIPSIVGKTLGTDGNDHLGVVFWFDAGSNSNSVTNSLGQQSGTFDIAQVQLEEGSVATPFEERPQGLELSLCQRYYQADILVSVGGGATPTSTNRNFYCAVNFPVQFRASPTLTLITTISSSNMNVGSWDDITSSRATFVTTNSAANDCVLRARYSGSIEL